MTDIIGIEVLGALYTRNNMERSNNIEKAIQSKEKVTSINSEREQASCCVCVWKLQRILAAKMYREEI